MRQPNLGRLVALKLVPQDAIGNDAARKRLVREARGAAALDHQNIVHVYDVGEMPDERPPMVVEMKRLLAKVR